MVGVKLFLKVAYTFVKFGNFGKLCNYSRVFSSKFIKSVIQSFSHSVIQSFSQSKHSRVISISSSIINSKLTYLLFWVNPSNVKTNFLKLSNSIKNKNRKCQSRTSKGIAMLRLGACRADACWGMVDVQSEMSSL
jgi:hypothetical protein